MTAAKYDVLGIGNAIFDVLVQTDEHFLEQHGMTKGGMALIDEDRAASIYRDMGPATEMSGGSAANTIVGVANLGARAAYLGGCAGTSNTLAGMQFGVPVSGTSAHAFTLAQELHIMPDCFARIAHRPLLQSVTHGLKRKSQIKSRSS